MPSSNLIPGTVRSPNSTRMPAACIGGVNSNTLYGTPFNSSAFSTVAHGWDPCTT